jgi:hypothetical protein
MSMVASLDTGIGVNGSTGADPERSGERSDDGAA